MTEVALPSSSRGQATEAAPGSTSSEGGHPKVPGRFAAWRRVLPWGLGLSLPGALLLLWFTVGSAVPPHILPPPGEVGRALWQLWLEGALSEHVGVTAGRVALGFAWGTGAATLLGALAGSSSLARWIVDPTVQALKAVPSLAWVPLFIVWFGIFETGKVALIAVGVFFPIYLNLTAAIRGTDRKLVEVARAHGLPPWAIAYRVLIPAALPSYLTGLRSGLALGWMFVIAAEIMGASQGLGFVMVDAQMTGRPAVIMAALIIFAVAGQVSDRGLCIAFRPFLRWQDDLESAEAKS